GIKNDLPHRRQRIHLYQVVEIALISKICRRAKVGHKRKSLNDGIAYAGIVEAAINSRKTSRQHRDTPPVRREVSLQLRQDFLGQCVGRARIVEFLKEVESQTRVVQPLSNATPIPVAQSCKHSQGIIRLARKTKEADTFLCRCGFHCRTSRCRRKWHTS